MTFGTRDETADKLRATYECNLGLEVEEIYSLSGGTVKALGDNENPSYEEILPNSRYQNRNYDFNERKTSFEDIYTLAWADVATEDRGKRYTFDEYTRKFFNRYDITNSVLTLLPQEIMVYQPKNTYGLLNKTVL